MRYYPIHTHFIPAGLHDTELVGAVVCVELNPKLLSVYYDWTGPCPTNTLSFLRSWHQISTKCCPLSFRPFFSLEGERGLDDTQHLAEMRTLGLVSIQLQREKVVTRFFHPKSGLTDQGKILLHEMAELDILLDLSHLHGPVLKHFIEHAPGPLIVSHVVCQDLFPWSLTKRANSMSANELLACAAQLYGVPFVDDLVSPQACISKAERRSEIRHVAEHIIRLAEIVGRDRVALGPDYFDYASMEDMEIGIVQELDQKNGLLQLQRELQYLGLNVDDVESIFWANAARVFPPTMENLV